MTELERLIAALTVRVDPRDLLSAAVREYNRQMTSAGGPRDTPPASDVPR